MRIREDSSSNVTIHDYHHCWYQNPTTIVAPSMSIHNRNERGSERVGVLQSYACRVGSVRKRYRFQPRTATRRSPEVVFHHVIRSDPLKLRRPAHKLQPSLQGRNRG